MNCPIHILIFRVARRGPTASCRCGCSSSARCTATRSPACVHGLTRVRGMTQDDAHIFCTTEQMARRARRRCSTSCSTCCATTGSTTSTWSCPPATTRRSPSAPTRSGRRPPRRCARRRAAERPGARARRGRRARSTARRSRCRPSDAIGRTWQMSTIQLDFKLPAALRARVPGADGTRQRPVMIHRALFGSIERFFGVLVEHYAGAFPAWLAPVQVVGIPIARRPRCPTCEELAERLRARGHPGRGGRAPTTGCRRRSATRRRRRSRSCCWPGTRTWPTARVSFRYRDGQQRNGVPLAEAVRDIVDFIASRDNAEPGTGPAPAQAPGPGS